MAVILENAIVQVFGLVNQQILEIGGSHAGGSHLFQLVQEAQRVRRGSKNVDAGQSLQDQQVRGGEPQRLAEKIQRIDGERCWRR